QKGTKSTKGLFMKSRSPLQSFCAFCAFLWLTSFVHFVALLAHRGSHRGDDGVRDSSFEELVELPGREIEIDWRVFNAFDDRAFRKSGIDHFDHAFVCQRRRLLKLRRRAFAGFGRRLNNTHGRGPAHVSFVLITTGHAVCTTRRLRTGTRSEDAVLAAL